MLQGIFMAVLSIGRKLSVIFHLSNFKFLIDVNIYHCILYKENILLPFYSGKVSLIHPLYAQCGHLRYFPFFPPFSESISLQKLIENFL